MALRGGNEGFFKSFGHDLVAWSLLCGALALTFGGAAVIVAGFTVWPTATMVALIGAATGLAFVSGWRGRL
jgi:hypothetical protein